MNRDGKCEIRAGAVIAGYSRTVAGFGEGVARAGATERPGLAALNIKAGECRPGLHVWEYRNAHPHRRKYTFRKYGISKYF